MAHQFWSYRQERGASRTDLPKTAKSWYKRAVRPLRDRLRSQRRINYSATLRRMSPRSAELPRFACSSALKTRPKSQRRINHSATLRPNSTNATELPRNLSISVSHEPPPAICFRSSSGIWTPSNSAMMRFFPWLSQILSPVCSVALIGVARINSTCEEADVVQVGR